ncbi:hypothetical protein SCP_0204900 [Sparassis crispa]|uniref:WD40 repeat-like protein n=1 Tax=Sparassis crispa TaxID=139825 RepID=A0A401GAV5_9APHY|nr:hypothetical protein SCP_0204900 [Sparassis crispa]GBE79292.1 hypothetical protein SCP_0204900 [Sparassis crispa]
MASSEKRSASPVEPFNPKKARTSLLTSKYKTSPTPESEPARAVITRGTEWLSISGLDRDTSSINTLIVRTTQELARQGKRLVHAPKLFPDGICFDWLLDFSAKEEDVKDLMNVEGVSQPALQTLFQGKPRGVRSTRCGSRGSPTEAPLIIHLLSDDESESPMLASRRVPQGGLDASNPICIDTDDEQDPPVSPPTKYPVTDGTMSRLNKNGSSIRGSSRRQALDDEGRTGIVSRLLLPEVEPESSSECGQSDMELDSDTEPSASIRANGSGQSLVFEPRTASPEHRKMSRIPAARRSSNSAPLCQPSHSMTVHRSSTPGSSASIESSRSSSVVPEVDVVLTTVSSRHSTDHPDVSSLYGEFNMLATSSDNDVDDDEDVQEDPASGSSSSGRGAPRSAPSTGTSEQALLHHPPHRAPARSSLSRSWSGGHARSIAKDPSIDTHRSASIAKLPRRAVPARNRLAHPNKGLSLSSDDEGDGGENLLEGFESDRLSLPSRKDPHVGRATGWEDTGSNGLSVNIPKTNFARGRRLLAPSDLLPYTTVAMRGDAQFIRKDQLISYYSLPPSLDPSGGPDHHVEDCCLIAGNTVVVGYDSRPCQVSLIPLATDQRPRRINLSHRAHNTVQETPTAGVSQLNRGISALAPVNGHRLRFLSGGHDKTVHLWTVTHNGENYTARSERLNISHSHPVHALAYRAFDETVLSCAGTCIHTTKLSAHRGHDPSQVSGNILQVHVHPQAPHLIILEVRHMDRQVQLYDTRKANFARTPCLEFGYRDTSNLESSTRTTTSRYTKGAPCMSFFGRGYADGTVRIWDYRKPNNVLTRFHCQRPAPVVHTVFSDSGSTVIAYGGHSVTFWDVNGST